MSGGKLSMSIDKIREQPVRKALSRKESPLSTRWRASWSSRDSVVRVVVAAVVVPSKSAPTRIAEEINNEFISYWGGKRLKGEDYSPGAPRTKPFRYYVRPCSRESQSPFTTYRILLTSINSLSYWVISVARLKSSARELIALPHPPSTSSTWRLNHTTRKLRHCVVRSCYWDDSCPLWQGQYPQAGRRQDWQTPAGRTFLGFQNLGAKFNFDSAETCSILMPPN